MRLVWLSPLPVAAFLGLAIAAGFGPTSLPASQQADPFKANSVWKGTCEQTDTNSSYPMVLIVQKCREGTFEAVTYYPTLGSALLKVRGRIDPNGTVVFREDKLLYGET